MTDQEHHFRGIAADGETLYLSHGGGIDVYSDGTLKALEIPPSRA